MNPYTDYVALHLHHARTAGPRRPDPAVESAGLRAERAETAARRLVARWGRRVGLGARTEHARG